jgi:hypothetical protein
MNSSIGMAARVHHWLRVTLLLLVYVKLAQMLRGLRYLLSNVSAIYPLILSGHTVEVTRIDIKTYN